MSDAQKQSISTTLEPTISGVAQALGQSMAAKQHELVRAAIEKYTGEPLSDLEAVTARCSVHLKKDGRTVIAMDDTPLIEFHSPQADRIDDGQAPLMELTQNYRLLV